MKNAYSLMLIGSMVILTSCSSSKNFAQSYYDEPRSGVTYQQFYDDLSPYGNWIMYPGYGYVWAPFEAGFRPYYSNGNWVYTDMGWTWVSRYRWGWAPFHYGRWMHDIRYGWVWIPGYEWGPAWVAWRGGGGYYGWAPLGPGMSINISFGMIPQNNWCFLPSRYITHRSMDRYYVRSTQNVTIIKNTTIINNYYGNNNSGRRYNSGPRVMDVEKQTNQRIAPVRIVNRTEPGNSDRVRNQISMYRPEVKQSDNANIKPRVAINAPVRKFDMDQNNNNRDQFQNNGITNGSVPNQTRPGNSTDRINNQPDRVIRRQFPENGTNNSSSALPPDQVQRQPVNTLPKREFKPADDRGYSQPSQDNLRMKEMKSEPERKMYPKEYRKSEKREENIKQRHVPVIKNNTPQMKSEEHPKESKSTGKRVFRHF